MKQNRFLSICMALLVLLSVFTVTAVPSFAADNPQTPVTVQFVDADTGEPVPVDFTYSQYQKGFLTLWAPVFSGTNQTEYHFTPTQLQQQAIIIHQVPESYYLKNNMYYFDYTASGPKLSYPPENMHLSEDGVITISLYPKDEPDNLTIKLYDSHREALYEKDSFCLFVQGQDTSLVSYISSDTFYIDSPGRYTVDVYENVLGNAGLFVTQFNIEYDGFTFEGSNWYQEDGTVAVPLDFKSPINAPTLTPLEIHFVDAISNSPVEVQWSVYPELQRELVNWEVEKEQSSGKRFTPEFLVHYNLENNYHLTIDELPDGYIWPSNKEIAFTYAASGLEKNMSEQDYLAAGATLDLSNNSIVIALQPAPAATPIGIQFQDRATGKMIAPDRVTVSPGNDSTMADTFQRNGTISFVPSYYAANQLSANYAISAQLSGYESVNLSDAFTYNGYITSSISNDYIAVTGNSIIIKMDKIAPVDPAPSVNLLKNGDFEGLNVPNWFQRGSNPTVMQTNSQYRSGAYSLYMAYFKNEAFNNHIDQTCFVNQSGNYKFSAYIKTDTMLTGAGAMLTLEARDANGLLLMSSSSPAISNTNGGWQQLSMQMYAPPGTASIVTKIGGVYCTGGFYVDDAELLYQS